MAQTLQIGPYTVPNCEFQWDNPAGTITYAASTTADLALPRDGFVTDLVAFMDPFQYDIATSALVANDDALIKGVYGLKVMADGGRNYWQMTDARGIHYFNVADYGDAATPGSILTAVATNNINRFGFIFHPGIYPMMSGHRGRNIRDLSAGIDAKQLATFQIEWASPANSVLGTNGTIDTTTIMRAYLGRWFGIPKHITDQLPRPHFTEDKTTITATSTDLGTTYNFPTKVWIKRSLVMVTDNGTAGTTDKRDDTRVTQIGIIKGGSTRRVSLTWRMFRYNTCLSAGWKVDTGSAQANVDTNDLPNTGIGIIEWSELTGLKWGLPPIVQQGDVQLGLTIGTGNGVFTVYNQSYENVPPWEANQRVSSPYHAAL